MKRRLDRALGLALLFAAFGLLVGAAVLMVRAPRPGPGEPTPDSIASQAEGAVQASRPAEVGNPVAEKFLRSLDRPTGMAETGAIRIEDETFSAAYDELYDHRDRYYGREIELAGFVEEQGGLPPGAYLIGRRLLWCCEDDAYFIGFLVLGEGDPPKAGATLRLRGRLEAAPYTNPESGQTITVPAIRPTSIQAAEGVPTSVFPATN